MTSRCNLYGKLSLMRKLHYIVKVKGFCRCGWSFMSVDFELAKRETVIGGPNWMSWKPLKVRDFLAGIVEGNIHIWKAHGEPCGRELGVTSRIILMPPASDASEHQPSSHRNINPANKPNELQVNYSLIEPLEESIDQDNPLTAATEDPRQTTQLSKPRHESYGIINVCCFNH